MTNTQRSRLALLKLVFLGCLAVPAFAATGGVAVFQSGPAGVLFEAPPPVVFMALGLAMVLGAVGRRVLKARA